MPRRCISKVGEPTYKQQTMLPFLIMNRSTLLRHSIVVMFLLFGFFDAQILAAQTLLEGTVRDADTGELLPAANIQIDGTFQGTITNAEGAFTLQVPDLPVFLLVRYIGYETARIEVTGESGNTLDIEMSPVVYSLDEVVVTDEDAAVSIMRKVIARKQEWREQLDAFEAEAYTRFTLENDTGIVSIIESVTEVYWKEDEGLREIVKAQRKTSNLEFDEFIPAAQFMANLYDDNIEIAGYDLIGVTHPNALRHYTFEIIGYRYIDDTLVYDISVTPRNKFKAGFSGQVSVLNDEYALLEVELEPGEAFLFPPPIRGFDIVFNQQFSNFGGGFWLPVDFRSEMDLEIGFRGLLTFPTIHIEQVSRMADYDINVALADSLFESDDFIQVDSVAVADSTMLDKSGLALPLEKAEVAAYETIDSTMTLEKAYEPEGALARFVQVEVEASNSDSSGSGNDRRRLDLGLDVDGKLRFNRVEGLYSELGIGRSFGGVLSINGGIGYSTAQTDEARWSYDVGGALRYGEANRFELAAGYARYTDTQTPGTAFLQLVNGAVTLLGGRDYYDYYRNERFRSTLSWRNRKLDTRFSVGVRLEEHASLDKKTDYDLLGETFVSRDNPAIEAGLLRAGTIGLHWGDEEDTGGFTGKKSFSLFIEHSAPGVIASDFDFTTYGAVLDWRFDTFFQRRLLPNTLDIKIEAQTSRGDVPFQRLGAINGSMDVLSAFGVLKTRELGPYRGDRHLSVFWEHNFRTFPFELLGLQGLAQNALNIIVFGGHGRTWMRTPFEDNGGGLQSLPEPRNVYGTNGWHHEAGISLSGIFSLMRVDFAKRLDAEGFYVGISTARIF